MTKNDQPDSRGQAEMTAKEFAELIVSKHQLYPGKDTLRCEIEREFTAAREREWVSVEEKLPEPNVRVLVGAFRQGRGACRRD